MRKFGTDSIGGFVLLWLCGICLRLTILAVPPLLPLIHGDLALSQVDVGILSSIPPLILAGIVIPGAWLVARWGVKRSLLAGLMVAAIGAAARGLLPDFNWLLLTTAVMVAGVAIMHPSLPLAVQVWTPRRIALATAVYTNGLLVGETIPVAITGSFLLEIFNGDWRLMLSAWSLPVFVCAVMLVLFSPQGAVLQRDAPVMLWKPDWRSPLVGWGGLLIGGVSSMYFGIHAYFPDFLHTTGRDTLIGPSLSALNVAQLPASLLMIPAASRLAYRFSVYLVGSAASLLGLLGMVLLDGNGVVWSAALLGFSSTVVVIASFAGLYTMCGAADASRISAGVMVIGYGCTVLTPVLSGWLWDVSGEPLSGLVPVLVWPIIMVVAAEKVGFRQRLADQGNRNS